MKTMIPLMLAISVLAGCEAMSTVPDISLPSEKNMKKALVTGEWQIETIEGKQVIEGSQPSLTFYEDGRLSGNASCNQLVGQYQQIIGELVFNPLGLTRKLCAPPVMSQEIQLLTSLHKVATMQVDDSGILLLQAVDQVTLLTASRKPVQ